MKALDNFNPMSSQIGDLYSDYSKNNEIYGGRIINHIEDGTLQSHMYDEAPSQPRGKKVPHELDYPESLPQMRSADAQMMPLK